MAQVVVRLDPAAVAATLKSQTGVVGRYLVLLAQKTQALARVKMGHKTHRLEQSLVKRWVMMGGELTIFLGSQMPYAEVHHEGAIPHIIRPVKAKALRFYVAGQSEPVFAKIVHHPGTQPNRYLTDSLAEVVAASHIV